MNELVQIIMQKTGLSQDQAQEVVNTVVSHLKGRLPAALTEHLNAFLGESAGGTPAGGMMDEAKSLIAGASSIFGKATE